MTDRVIVDTGPLVAFLDGNDRWHEWTAQQFRRIRAPLLTCEAVLAEAMFLLRAYRPAQDRLMDWLESGTLECAFQLSSQGAVIRALWKKHADVPMSLADACLVRITEMFDDHRLCTLDSDFGFYRKHGRHPIPLLWPHPNRKG